MFSLNNCSRLPSRDTEYYDYGHGEAQESAYEAYGTFKGSMFSYDELFTLG